MSIMRWLPLVLCATLLACGGDDGERRALVADSLALAAEATRAAELLEPVRSVGMAVVEYAGVAVQRATSEDVRHYAEVIVADHRAVESTLDSVAQTLGAATADTAAARELQNAVRTAHSGLETLSGPEFDLTYIRAEVESHRLLLDRLDQELIPAMRRQELRTLLQQVRAMTDAHLTRARQLLAQQLGQPDPTPRRLVPRPAPDTGARPPRPDTLARPAPAAPSVTYR